MKNSKKGLLLSLGLSLQSSNAFVLAPDRTKIATTSARRLEYPKIPDRYVDLHQKHDKTALNLLSNVKNDVSSKDPNKNLDLYSSKEFGTKLFYKALDAKNYQFALDLLEIVPYKNPLIYAALKDEDFPHDEFNNRNIKDENGNSILACAIRLWCDDYDYGRENEKHISGDSNKKGAFSSGLYYDPYEDKDSQYIDNIVFSNKFDLKKYKNEITIGEIYSSPTLNNLFSYLLHQDYERSEYLSGREALIDEMIDQKLLDYKSLDQNGQSPLHVSLERKDILKRLLKHDAKVNTKNLEGQTPLEYSLCSDWNKDVVALLVNSGADLFVKNGDDTVVYMLSTECYYEPTDFILNLEKTIIDKMSDVLDQPNKIKTKDFLNKEIARFDQPNYEGVFKSNLFVFLDKLIHKYNSKEQQSIDFSDSYKILLKTFEKICNTRNIELKDMLMAHFFDIINIEKKQDDYVAFCINANNKKGIPDGLEGVSLILHGIFSREQITLRDFRDNNENDVNSCSIKYKEALAQARKANCDSKSNSQIIDEAISKFSAHDFRSSTTVKKVLSPLDNLQRQIIDPEELQDLLASIIAISKSSKELVRNINHLETMVLSFPNSEILANLNSNSMNNFKSILHKMTQKFLEIPDSLESQFNNYYEKLRIPESLITYYGAIKDIPEVKKVFLENFVRDYVEGNFYKKVYQEIGSKPDKKTHFDIVFNQRSELLTKWKKEESQSFGGTLQTGNKNEKQKFIVTRSKNPFDMFMLGTDTKSCQEVNGGGYYNKCLMGYVLDPCTQAIMIKRESDGMIVGRSVIRMLWNQKKKYPVLLLEKPYFNDLAPMAYDKILKDYSKKIAKKMGVPLVSYVYTEKNEAKYPYDLVSYDSGNAPYQYVDALGTGISNGSFRLIESPNLLYKPPFEPKLDSEKNYNSKVAVPKVDLKREGSGSFEI